MAKSKWPLVLEKIENGLVEAWARDGLTDEQIAGNLGIAVSTFYAYKLEHGEFSEALKSGKEIIDYQVENALLKRALGYGYQEVTREPLYNVVTGEPILGEDGKPVIVVKKVVSKQMAPDVTAQIFWLKNRKPGEWRDKQDVRHEGGIEIVMAGDVSEFAE